MKTFSPYHRASDKARRPKAQALVEFAAVLPLLLFMALMMLETGRLAYTQIVVTNAAWEGARVGATLAHPEQGDAEIMGAVRQAAYGLDASRLKIQIQPTQHEYPRNLPAPYPRGYPLKVKVTYELPLFLWPITVPITAQATTVMEYQNP